MKKALLFDLDGTLWDAILPIKDSWNKAMEDYHQPYRFTLEMIKSYMGLTPEETAVIAFPDVPLNKGIELFNVCLKEEIKYLATHPGVMYPNEEKIISLLSKKYPLYIISNCGSGYIENYLNALHMNSYFIDHVCIGDTGLPKWQNILLVKERDKLDQVIYIGDTMKDKTESEKANVNFIHAAYGFGTIENDQYYIDDISLLTNKIEEIFNLNK